MKRMSALAVILAMSSTAFAAETAPGDVTIEAMAVAQPVAEEAGDPEAGREVFISRKQGNCLACHMNSEIEDAQFPGNVGPTMDGVADRWETAQLRAIIVNSKEVFGPQTIMPGFYTLDVGTNVAEKHQGKTILTAEQVEDVVAYLATLKGN